RGRPPPPARAPGGVGCPRRSAGGWGVRTVLAAEAIDAAGGVDQALLAGVIRVALGAHFHADRADSASGLEAVAALAMRGDGLVDRVQIRLHGTDPLWSSP